MIYGRCKDCGSSLTIAKINNSLYYAHFCIKCGYYAFSDNDCFTTYITPDDRYLKCLTYV